jgi:hypothetical protein
MQSEPLSGGSGLDPGNEASLSSFSVDDEISHAPSNNNYSTISIVDHSEVHVDDDDESSPAGVEAGREICLGLEASGGGTSGDIIEGDGGLTTRAPVMTTGQYQREDPLRIYVLKMGWPCI